MFLKNIDNIIRNIDNDIKYGTNDVDNDVADNT